MDESNPLPTDLSDDRLEEVLHGPLGRTTSWGGAQYLEERNRRAVERQTSELIALTAELRALTSQIRWLTWAAIGIALVGVIVAVAAVVLSRLSA